MVAPRLATCPGHRFPAKTIHHVMQRYQVMTLGLRPVGLCLSEQGITVAREEGRRWCLMVGQVFASSLQRRRPKPRKTRGIGEPFVRIGGALHRRRRAINRYGLVLEIVVQDRRNTRAAQRCSKRLATAAADPLQAASPAPPTIRYAADRSRWLSMTGLESLLSNFLLFVCEAAKCDARHGGVEQHFAGLNEVLEVSAHAPVSPDPGECSLYHPAALEHVEVAWDLEGWLVGTAPDATQVGPVAVE